GTVIGGLERLVVAADPAAVEAFYGITGVLGPLTNRLSNGGGVVRLRNQMDAILLEVEYSDAYPWPVAADGAGHSLVLARPDYGEDSIQAWGASGYMYGSPGAADPTVSDPLSNIVLNEILAHTDLPQIDFIELHNHSTQPVNISGCVISDNPDPNIPGFVVPAGTILTLQGFVAFDHNQLGFSLSMHGDDVYLRSPAGDRVLDAVNFGAQENGVSLGRYPDGGPEYRVLSATSPGYANDEPASNDIVINEIMYHPISEETLDEYVELFNRGGSDVFLDHWRFTQGIRYTFPEGTVIPAGGYLVVAKDAARLMAAHPGVLSASNTVGDFSGNLSDRGERIVLCRPDDPLLPEEDFVVVDEVWYRDGESWGEWSDGDGSSLELIDPYSDNMRGMNWTDSDETAKAPWTLIEHTGVLDLGRNAADEIQVLLEGTGEALVDDVEVFKVGEASRVANGTFESGIGGWIIQGTHIDSHLETSEGHLSSQSLRLVASRKGDNSVNRVETDLTASLAGGETATIRAYVRWLRGCPYVLLRLHGNWLEAAGEMIVPADLGTPGERNSGYAANAGPAIDDVAHAPVLPAAYENVVVTARVADVDGVSSVELKYRNDTDAPSTVYTLAMNDGGTGGDALAGDGIYSVTVPGLAASKLMAFHVEATDAHAQAATTRFPAGAPAEECHVMFAQADPAGSFGTYRFWMTEADRAEWASRQGLSDHPVYGTFVYGDFRVIYNAGARFRGSPFVRSSGDPETRDTSYVFYVPKDSRLLGSTSLNLDRLEGDDTRQRERMSLWLADQVDTPFFYQRYVNLFVNERHKGTIYGDSQQPNDDFVTYWWPDGQGGELFKIDDWFEFNDNSQVSREFNENGQLVLYTTTGGEKKKARYRWSWRKESVEGFDDDYTSFYQMVDALNLSYTSPQYAALVPALVDYEEWMHVFAVQHVIRNWDSYGYNRGKNMSTYKPADGKWQMIMWDLDHSHLTGSPTESNLFSINCPTMRNSFFRYPPFLRAYWRAISEIANGPMRAEVCDPLMDANYAAFQANGISVTSPDSALKQWIADRRAWLLGQLNGVAADFEITTNGGSDLITDQQTLSLSGTAPVEVRTFGVNGAEAEVTFTSVTEWNVELGLEPGENVLTVEGFDSWGNLIGSDTITVTCTHAGASPAGQLVITEIMYHPDASDAEFIEIHNISNTHAFNLSGWRLDGVDFTFAPGSVIGPGKYAVLAENATAFASAYGGGPSRAVMGEYGQGGSLANGGERLRLQMPAGEGLLTTIDEVSYGDDLPWPTEADGSG
ncbi:MAG: lamin tail domain-containing protein, partial [Phycisphaerae bacterium]